METIGERIKRLRQNKNLTLRDIEKITNIKSGPLSLIENDKCIPSLTRSADIAKALGVSVDYLATGEEKKEEASNITLVNDSESELIRNIQQLTPENKEIVKGLIDMMLSKQKEAQIS